MDGMATAQDLRRRERIEEVFAAYGAVLLHRIGDACVVVEELYRVACSTCIAVEKVVAPPYATDATLITVELLL